MLSRPEKEEGGTGRNPSAMRGGACKRSRQEGEKGKQEGIREMKKVPERRVRSSSSSQQKGKYEGSSSNVGRAKEIWLLRLRSAM